MAALNAYYDQGTESSQADNSANSDDPDAATATGDSAPADEPDVAAADEQTDAAATGDATAEPDAADAAPTSANFDGLNKTVEFLPDADAIKAKFPRNSSKELIEYAASASAAAVKGNEVLTQLGGEPFIEPLTDISTGLRDGSSTEVFNGIIKAASHEGLLKVFGDAMGVILNADHFAKNPETELFGQALQTLSDRVLQARFGDTANVASITRMAELASQGWLERIDDWQKQGWVDRDEAAELIASGNDPKLIAEREAHRKTQAQLEEKNRQDADKATAQGAEFETSFIKSVTESIDTTLKDVIWSSSTLRDVEKDTPEMTQQKTFLRNYLRSQAIDAFNASDARKALLEGFKYGRSGTATYATQLTDAINTALLQTRENTAVAEGIIAKLYGTTRNAQLTKKPAPAAAAAAAAANNTAPSGLAPTKTKQFEPSEQFKTSDDILENMTQRIAAHEG